jgi:TetR/AcrR family transcriptional regulator, tetracycline repressor protein
MGRRKGRAPLNRERILAAALKLIDDAGLDALSMRKLGGVLGVDPMAVYHHIPNKEALLHAVVKQVFSVMAVPAPEDAWQERVRQWAHAYRDIALAHPNLVLRIVSDPMAVAVAAVEANESLYAALESAGLDPGTVVRAADLIVDFVNGFVLAHASGAAQDPAAAAAFHAELEARPADRVAVQRRLLSHPDVAGGRDSFEFALDLIFTGLETLTRR